MKYIKTYENIKYEAGDYVLLKDHFVNKNFSLKAKILSTKYKDVYQIKRFRILDITGDINWYDKNNIERKLTSEEIVEFELMENIEKYNI